MGSAASRSKRVRFAALVAAFPLALFAALGARPSMPSSSAQSSRSTPTPPASRRSARSPPTRSATSSWCGAGLASDLRDPRSGRRRVRRLRPALRQQRDPDRRRVPGQHLHRVLPGQLHHVAGRGERPRRRLRRGLGQLRPGRRRTASSPSGSRAPEPSWRWSSRSIRTRMTPNQMPFSGAIASDADGDFVVVWSSPAARTERLRCLRPALRERRREARHRVPGQHHRRRSAAPPRSVGRARRRFRRRLGEHRHQRRRHLG